MGVEWGSQPKPSQPGKVHWPPASFPGTTSGSPSKAADILLTFLFYRVNPFLFPFRAYTCLLTPPTPQSYALHWSRGGEHCWDPVSYSALWPRGALWFHQGGLPTPLFQQLSPDSWTLPFLSVPLLVRGTPACWGWAASLATSWGESPSAMCFAPPKPPVLTPSLRPAILVELPLIPAEPNLNSGGRAGLPHRTLGS